METVIIKTKNSREIQEQVQTSPKMASRGAIYQRKYKKKVKETNKLNAEFMEYAPELVRNFFEEKAVIIYPTNFLTV